VKQEPKIVVLTNPGNWYYKDLLRAASEIPAQVECARTTRMGGIVAPGIPIDSVPANQIGFGPEIEFGNNDYAVLVRTMPIGSLEQVVFRMNALQILSESGVQVINSPRSLEICIDKYLTLARLSSEGVRTPETHVSQNAEQAMHDFEALNQSVVVKPVFGGEGRGILRCDDPDMAYRIFKSLERIDAVIFQQRFIQHNQSDIRILWVGDQNYCIRRVSSNDWRTNLARGALAEPFEPDDEQMRLAQLAKDVCGADIAGVDILVDQDTREPYVIEVNAVPGWRGAAAALGIDIAKATLSFVLKKMQTRI